MRHLYYLTKNGLMPYSLVREKISRTVPPRSNFYWVKIPMLHFRRNQKANGISSPKSFARSSTTSSCPVNHISWSFRKFTSILFVLCFVQEKSAAPTFKILLVLFPTPTIIYAYQRPSSTPLPKSVIGTIPNTNNYLRYPAPIFKIYIQKYYWCYSQDQ